MEMGANTHVSYNSDPLKRVREEVERLEFCLEDAASGWKYGITTSDHAELLPLSQEVSGLSLELR